MKHLLIILSILLLSSPVIGQETGVLYQYETSSGLVWKTFGNEKVQPKYEGEITNGKPNGFGFMTYPFGEKSVVGEYKNGKEWNTKHRKKDGTIIGKFENGVRKFGLLYRHIMNNKVRYFEFEKDGKTDIGKLKGEYVGEIKNGKPNGRGKITWEDGSSMKGVFENGVLKHH